jgi:hypothetical protein
MVKSTGSSIKPYLQPFDHFFTLKNPWHKVIHDEDTGEKRGETSNGGSGFAKAKSEKNLGWGPRIFPAGRKANEFFTALFGFGILNSELLLCKTPGLGYTRKGPNAVESVEIIENKTMLLCWVSGICTGNPYSGGWPGLTRGGTGGGGNWDGCSDTEGGGEDGVCFGRQGTGLSVEDIAAL